MEKKNILLIKGHGVYDAVGRYIDEFASAFRKLGYNTCVLDGNIKGFKQNFDWMMNHHKIYAIVDCQGMFLDSGLNYDYKYNIAKIHYFCDHPMHHFERFIKMDNNSIVINLDRKHTEYIRKYYTEIKQVAFVPLSGTGAEVLFPYEKRKIDILFTGSYWQPKMPVVENPNAGFADAVKWKVQKMMLEHPYMTIENALEKVFATYRVDVTKEEFVQILNELVDVELYVRAYYRDKLMRTLLAEGFEISVYGSGWDRFLCDGIEHLHILSGGAEVARRALGDAKIALNIMPGFKAGFQERIAAAMLSETAVVTDISEYIEEEFEDGRELVLYRVDELDKLPSKIKYLLENLKETEKIAQNGKMVAGQKHEWRHRVKIIAEQIEKFYNSTQIGTLIEGVELEIPLEIKRVSYGVEEIGVKLSENLNIINDLYNQGYVCKSDVKKFLELLKSLNQRLIELCGHRFFSGENIEFFSAHIWSMCERKECFDDAVRLLILASDSILCGIRQKFEDEAIRELAIGMPADKNRDSYKKLQKQLLKEKYDDSKDPFIEIWKSNFEGEGTVEAYPRRIIDKYLDCAVNIEYDESADMLYIRHYGKRMYFPRELSVKEIYMMYRFCMIEQDRESSHCYLNENFQVTDESVVIDAGVAEGNFSLEIIDKVKKIFLVECDERWIPALEQTFAPYKDKVVIVPKMLGNRTDGNFTTIDEIVKGEHIDFIKMDVEGAEADALLGAKHTFANNPNIKCVVATYHKQGMGERVQNILNEYGLTTSESEGYILFTDYESPIWENELRHALVRAER